MIIATDTLSLLLPDDVHPVIAHNRVARFFCTPNSVNGHCTTDCKNCKPFLLPIFQDLSQARDPTALMVWRLRNASAKLADSTPHQATQPTDQWGLSVERNPFETILKELA